eukprot:12725295-Prorocentrum_lima.AAC.1
MPSSGQCGQSRNESGARAGATIRPPNSVVPFERTINVQGPLNCVAWAATMLFALALQTTSTSGTMV